MVLYHEYKLTVEGKIIDKPAQPRGESSIKLHNLFLINVDPVIIVAVACRLTVGSVEIQCFEMS